jgi:hypothetical protein
MAHSRSTVRGNVSSLPADRLAKQAVQRTELGMVTYSKPSLQERSIRQRRP